MKSTSFFLPAYLKALSVMLFIIVLVFTLIVGKGLLVPLFMGGFFAILLTPFCNFMERNKIPRTLSCLISLLLTIAITVGLISFIVGNVVSFSKDFENVSGRLSTMAGQIDTWTARNLGIYENLEEKVNSIEIKEYLNSNSKSITSFALNAIGSLSALVLIPVFMFFLLFYREHLTRVMVMIYNDKEPSMVRSRITSLRKLIQNYIVGVGKVMVILAILNIIAYSLIGVKHAVFFGLIGAILNIIPYVGPLIGVVLPVIYSFLTMDSFVYPLLILGAYQVIQILEGNVLTPKIVGGNVNLNAFITLLGLLIGAAIWGIAGMILVIPTLAILREIFDLSEQTRPFAILLGEDKEEQKKSSKNESSK